MVKGLTLTGRLFWLVLPLVAVVPARAAAQMSRNSGTAQPPATRVAQPLSDSARAIHLLQRTTFGVIQQDVAEVLHIGTKAWLDKQLHPERSDDSALEQRLLEFPASSMTIAQLYSD